MTADPSWPEATLRARAARVVLVIGETDTGKTSLATYLANALFADGLSVAVVDADLGQSSIGPPTTVGLGRVSRPLECLADAEVLGLHFVGYISPAGHLLSTVLGTRALTGKALGLGFDRVVVDTSGFVQGDLGRRLKQRKIGLLAPDLVVCLQRDGECEHILAPYASGPAPAVLRLAASDAARRRSPEERRQRRGRSFAAYFAGARVLDLDLERVVLRRSAASAAPPLLATRDQAALSESELGGLLAGLDDGSGETLGLGIVRSLDTARRGLVVETPVPGSAIAAVRLGRVRLDEAE